MKIPGHTTITLAVGSILYYYSHSFSAFLSFLISSIFIDLDHYLDYIREYGVSFNFKRVYSTFDKRATNYKKITIFLHSYELMIIIWLAILLFNLSIIWRYVAIGFTLHLFIDQMTNPILPFAYFLSFRIVRKFETNKLLKGGGNYV